MYGGASSSRDLVPAGLTEFEILKASHKCVRVLAFTSSLSLPSGSLKFSQLMHQLERHCRFLREDDDETDARAKAENADASGSSWGDRLAQKYYASLYREFAVCDLKHYKSGNVSIFHISLVSFFLIDLSLFV